MQDWDSWKEKIATINDSSLESEGGYVSNLLFRGQKCASWDLESTIERKGIDLPSVANFSNKIKKTKLAFESYLDTVWPSKFSGTDHQSPPENYEFMVYLRHHGYPTPLLDWSRSPYIASFFAFQYPSEDDEIAIYSFREYSGKGKSSCASNSTIIGCGPTIRTHKRHYVQQAEYTYCRKKISNVWHYSSHKEAFKATKNEQDLLQKFTLPAKLRSKVLSDLDAMNINAFTLYGSEEGLAEMLFNREYGYLL